jgi:DNA (cytosine-5)-methyltransferase 1
MRPRLLDLFCGAGGAAVGYHRAGFDVVGVDIKLQPNYPFEFVQDDALALLSTWTPSVNGWWDEPPFDAIHASPPCQRWASGNGWHDNEHPDLISPFRPLLEEIGLPSVIENVPGAPLRRDVILCGTQFGLKADRFEVRRHRVFELNWPIGTLVPPCQHNLPAMPVFGHNPNGDFYKRYGGGVSIDTKRQGMGIDWMNRDELREAIPPAYTELIGHQLLSHLNAARPQVAETGPR